MSVIPYSLVSGYQRFGTTCCLKSWWTVCFLESFATTARCHCPANRDLNRHSCLCDRQTTECISVLFPMATRTLDCFPFYSVEFLPVVWGKTTIQKYLIAVGVPLTPSWMLRVASADDENLGKLTRLLPPVLLEFWGFIYLVDYVK
jgi:hypothetical protein